MTTAMIVMIVMMTMLVVFVERSPLSYGQGQHC